MGKRNDLVIDRAIEIFGALLGQEFATSSLTPRDTTRMARTFASTMKVVDTPKGKTVRFTTPFYTEFVNNGTSRITARRFIQKIIHQRGEALLKQAFRIANKQI